MRPIKRSGADRKREPLSQDLMRLKTLSEEAKEPMDENLTKAQASERIEELQKKTGRGLPH